MSNLGTTSTNSSSHEEFCPKHGCNGCVRVTSVDITRTEYRITKSYPKYNGPAKFVFNDVYFGPSSQLLSTHKKTSTEDMAKFFGNRYVEVIIDQHSIDGFAAGNRTVLDMLHVPQWIKWKAIISKVAISIVVPSAPILATEFKNSTTEAVVTGILAELATYAALAKVNIILKIQDKEAKDNLKELAPYLFPIFDVDCPLQGCHLSYQVGEGKATNVSRKDFVDLRNAYKEFCKAERLAAEGVAKREKELDVKNLDEFPGLGGSRQKTRNN